MQARHRSRLQRLVMTPPDERRSRSSSRTTTPLELIVQPDFGLQLAEPQPLQGLQPAWQVQVGSQQEYTGQPNVGLQLADPQPLQGLQPAWQVQLGPQQEYIGQPNVGLQLADPQPLQGLQPAWQVQLGPQQEHAMQPTMGTLVMAPGPANRQIVGLNVDPFISNVPLFHVLPQTPQQGGHSFISPELVGNAPVMQVAPQMPAFPGIDEEIALQRQLAVGLEEVDAIHNQHMQRHQAERQLHIAELRQQQRYNESRRRHRQQQIDSRRTQNPRRVLDAVQRQRVMEQQIRTTEEQDAQGFNAVCHAEVVARHQMLNEMQREVQYQHGIPRGCQPYAEPIRQHSVGPMSVECSHCHALHFDSEKLSKSTRDNPCFGSCCLQGQIKLPTLPQPPQPLKNLLYGISPLSQEFRRNICQYNAAFAFTSVGVNIDRSVLRGSGPYCFKINGELHHSAGALMPAEGSNPQYAQLYIHDPAMQLRFRQERNPRLNHDIMAELQGMLHMTHPYIPLYKQAFLVMQERPAEEHDRVYIKLTLDRDADRRRYNLPTVDEIAAVVPGDGSEERCNHRDIILHLQGGGLKRISHLHPSYSTLHYVLLFPRGEVGYHLNIATFPGPGGRQRSEKVSQRCYYAYQLHGRSNEPSTILRGGRLLQQYVVDAWASTEQSNLNWVRHHQRELRADVYQGLRDAANNSDNESPDLAQQGQQIILPSTHLGSARHMYQLFQDSMAICRFARKPDLFLTMTANPKWPEINQNLLRDEAADHQGTIHCQEPSDRPDIVARVFEQKKESLLKEIKQGLFGSILGMVYTIEFQKRGLPHMHLLIFLNQEHKIYNPTHVDAIVSAKIPDPATQPLLYGIVTSNMMHGPCGARNLNSPCMVDGKCSKRYPKEFCEETMMGEDGYPQYARPNNGSTFTDRRGNVYDNRDVVPHNPYLTARYGCHINVEVCASVKAIKYIHKYIYKGHDHTTVEIHGQRDEIKEYLEARYISPVESCWHLFEFLMHAEQPTVYRLPIHLPNQQLVYYNEDDDVDEILERGSSRKTPLTEYFAANQRHAEAAQITYQEFPQKFTWNKSSKTWSLRQRGFAIGRMYFAAPSSGERFYLRTLLTVVKGAKSFEDLRTVDGQIYPDFKSACLALGLLEDDREWIQCLEEAGDMQTGSQLRHLFATILLHCNPTSPGDLWIKFREKICDDLPHAVAQNYPDIENPSPEHHFDYGLYLLEKILSKSGKHLCDFPSMPAVRHDWGIVGGNTLLREQLDYDPVQLSHVVATNSQRFNAEQKEVFDAVMLSVNESIGQTFFLHSAGGGGKTYVCNTIAAAVRARGKVCLCVASSGIASLLLDGGRTAHSCFQIPIPVNETSLCRIKKGTFMHEVISSTAIIIWDEVPMQHKHAVEALDRTLQDLLNNTKVFGGITVLFGGDFCQTLPVVPKGSRGQIVSASLQKSRLWNFIKVYHLKRNMRLDQSPENVEFAKWLLQVGSGETTNDMGKITLRNNMHCGQTVDDLITAIYPEINVPGKGHQYFLDRAILSCRNSDVFDLNAAILAVFPGDETNTNSADSVVLEAGADSDFHPYPVEFLNSIKVPGLPLAHLALKEGCPIMLLRNLDPSQGLCNGTRLILLRVRPRVLECCIIGGKFMGKTVFIPRITLQPSSEDMPVRLQRHQFPVHLAFAMTVNKSQGQSLQYVGLDLRTPVFSHGQLYVALSRCTSGNHIKVLLPSNQGNMETTNIVYKEVLAGVL